MSPWCATQGGSASPTTPRQSRAVRPVYVGCIQLSPELNENWIPDPPTSVVNGHVLSVPALQASMSMLSLSPAATSHVRVGSIATAGSFCLFCENTLSLLPMVTSVSPPWVALAGIACNARSGPTSARPRTPAIRLDLLMSTLPSDGGSVVPGRPPDARGDRGEMSTTHPP